MNVSVRSVGRGSVVEVSGDVDMKASPELRRALFEALKAAPRVALSLSSVRYMDSSGIAVMIESVREAKRLTRPLVLFGISPAVYSVFKLTHVTGIFQIVETEEQALEA